jgi:hypothetical protein
MMSNCVFEGFKVLRKTLMVEVVKLKNVWQLARSACVLLSMVSTMCTGTDHY